eukprot:1823300-Pyramimonas_sp.AAC.1
MTFAFGELDGSDVNGQCDQCEKIKDVLIPQYGHNHIRQSGKGDSGKAPPPLGGCPRARARP